MIFRSSLCVLALVASLATAAAQSTLVLNPPTGAANAKHVVLLSGDEEYRSEEALPQLAKILSQRHGFKCTVLFALDPDGTINPDNARSLPGAEALDSADVIIMSLRFRAWPDDAMKHFVDAYLRGTPIIALRTSTHAFNFPADSAWAKYTWNNRAAPWPGGFGKNVLGETWVTHWGRHKFEATRAAVEPGVARDPLLRGVGEIFVTTDVYEAAPPADAKIIFRGLVLKGMNPTDAPADTRKKRAGAATDQPVNDPAMPIAWTRLPTNEAGKQNKILTTTMGAASDLTDENLRRFIVNGVYWALGRDVPARADVRTFDSYAPRTYGFKGYRTQLKPADHALGKVLAEGGPPPPQPPPPAPKKNAPPAAPAPKTVFQFSPGEHIAIVGNALGDRMQFHGALETLLHAKFPQHNLVVRNLAFAGDEVATRARSQDFGTPDEWLTRAGASVVFAFFGFNESFRGPDGVAKFTEDLDKFLRDTRAQNYSGLGAPRIVLFSPIAAEKLPNPDVRDPVELNANLALYTKAMADVARDRAGVTFVDLFTPSQKLYADAARAGRALTHNGVHLTETGDAALAPVIFETLTGERVPAGDFTKLRAAILEKNDMWHSRYRTVDGYNVYGGRSKLSFVSEPDQPKITNNQVMQQEMAQRDVLTANLDHRVWAVARGGDLPPDDPSLAPLPPVTVVHTNKPGPNPDGSHPFLDGEEAIAKMKVHAGLKVNLFADEKQFPDLAKPVQMAWDTRGRLWVAVWPNYPERTPESKVGDKLIILEDTDGDGRADKCTTFLDGLNAPTGFQLYKDGALVVQAPDVWFVRDTDGDGRADWKERVLMGLDSADSHHTSNSLAYEPGGAIFLSDGVFHRTQAETPFGVVRNLDAAIHRFEPRTGRFEVYASYAFANPHGRTFDRWGNDLIVDGTGNNTYFAAAFTGQIDYPAKHPKMKTFWDRPSRPSAGSAILTSRHMPEEFWGNFFNGNVIGFLGFYRVKIVDDGSGLKGERQADLISSSDPNFRPVAINVGPDGAYYFLDWHNPIIGHMQHHMRDPNRDHVHGRIYRITAEGRPLVPQPKIYGQPIPALLDLLKAPENHVRELAKIELDRHPTSEVMAATNSWVARLDQNDPDYAHHLTEALWLHQWHNVVDADLLRRVLHLPSADARAAATRVLSYWRDRVPDAMALLTERAGDDNARVRLHAVRAASFFRTESAVEVAIAATKKPLDYYLDYVLGETVKQLRPFWKNALGASGIDATAAAFLLRTLPAAELLKLPKTPAVLEQIVMRPGLSDAARAEALPALAAQRKEPAAKLLLAMLESSGDTDNAAIARLLVARPPAELRAVRDQLLRVARNDVLDERATGWAAVVAADASIDDAWVEAEKSPIYFAELLRGLPLLTDPKLRAQIIARVLPLLETDSFPGASQDQFDSIQRAAIRAAAATRAEPAKLFHALARLIKASDEVAPAARALRGLPRANWEPAEAPALVAALIAWAKKIPGAARTDREYLETWQTADALLSLLPPEEAAPLRTQLRGLRVAMFVVRTVPEEMRYDTPRLVVEAGRRFQLIFENPDAMPHNLVIVKPGARERVANLVISQQPDQLDRQGRAFVPESIDVVAATKLVEPGQSETLRVLAPETEGVYEFVCTFPGHWVIMWGQLVVTKNLAAEVAVADVPAATPTTHAHPH